MRDPLGWIETLFVAFLCACAARSQPPAAVESEPDCSFRSPTTCWTVSGRFPPVLPKPAAPAPDRASAEPPALANRADSTRTTADQ